MTGWSVQLLAAELPDKIGLPQISDALQRVDDIVGEIRDYVFASPGRGGQTGDAPPSGSR